MPLPPALRLLRSIVRRSFADWPVTLAAAVLLLTAATVVTADGLYADVVTLGGLRRSIEQAPPDDRNILVSMRAAAAEITERDGIVRSALDDALATVGGDVVREADASWLEPVEASPFAGALSGLASYELLEEHATLVAGRWAEVGADQVEATLPANVAIEIGLEVGQRIEIADSRDPTDPIAVEIVGTWRPTDGDPFWSWVNSRGTRAEGAAPPLVVAFDDVRQLAVSAIAVRWWTLPAIDRLRIDQVEMLRRDVASLGPSLQERIPASGLTVNTSMPAIIDDAARSLLVTRAGILALGAQFAVLAIYAVVLVSSILVERRRGESSLLAARGGSSWHLAAMAFGEALILALPVALAAPWLALAIVRGIAGLTGTGEVALIDAAALGQTSIVLAAVSAAVGALGLTLGAVVFHLRHGRAQATVGRPQSRTMAQRLGIDLALVGVAAIGFWQLRTYGAPLTTNARGTLGIDPLLVLTPAIGLLAAVVLATRFLPRLAELAERALIRLHGAVAPLAARSMARRPLRFTRSALLLMLAVALATFAALYGGSWTASQSDQATYRAAADVRVMVSRSPVIPTHALGDAYRGVPDVDAAAPIFRNTVRIGRAVRDAQLVALDPAAVASVLNDADPGLTATLRPLTDGRPTVPAISIEGVPRRMALTLDADLRAQLPEIGELGEPLPGSGIGVAVLLLDGDGRPQRVESVAADAALFSGTDQRIELPLTADAGEAGELSLTDPLRLLGVEIVMPGGLFAGGSVELLAVESSDADAGNDWSNVPLDAAAAGWHWDRTDVTGVEPYESPVDAPGRIEVGGASASNPIFSATTFRLWPVRQLESIRAVVGSTFLVESGTRVGDTITASGAIPAIPLEIVASVETFPTLDPGVPFVIVDDATLEISRLAADGQPTPASEWWLRVTPGAEALVLERLRSPAFSASGVIGRQELTDELSTDPVALGILGVLGLGSIAAMAFAGIAFLASATVTTSERVAEFAILRALGLSVRQLAAWLAAESAFLLGFGLIAGSAAGIGLGFLVLPFASFTQDGSAAVPSPMVVIPWAAVVPLYGMTALLFVASLLATRRQLPSVRITDVLRGREESG